MLIIKGFIIKKGKNINSYPHSIHILVINLCKLEGSISCGWDVLNKTRCRFKKFKKIFANLFT